MKSHKVILLGGKNNRRILNVFNDRTMVTVPVPAKDWHAPSFLEPKEPAKPEPMVTETYIQRHFRCGEFKFSWWCLQELNPQECLLCFTYPYGCNEIVAIRRELPHADKHRSIPIPHGWKQNVRKDPTQLLDQHSIEAVRRYEDRNRK